VKATSLDLEDFVIEPVSGGIQAGSARIPHGTSLVSQGTAKPGTMPLQFPAVSITPFVIGQPGNLIQFPETKLAQPTQFSHTAGGHSACHSANSR